MQNLIKLWRVERKNDLQTLVKLENLLIKLLISYVDRKKLLKTYLLF